MSGDLRHPKIATSLLAAVFAVSLIAASCGSSEESVGDPTTTTDLITTTSTSESPPTTGSASGSTIARTPTTVSPSTTTVSSTTIPEERIPEEREDESAEAVEELDAQTLLMQMECDALFDYIQEKALERVGPNGLEGYDVGVRFRITDGKIEELPSFLGGITEISSSPRVDVRPAVRVPLRVWGVSDRPQGVEEADIVDADSQRIFGLISEASRSELWVVDISNPTPRLTKSLVVPNGDYFEFHLSGSRLFMIGRSWVGIDPPDGEGIVADRSGDGIRLPSSAFDTDDAVVVTEVDISDPDNPEPVRHLRVEGRYAGSHAAEGYIRVVINSRPVKVGLVEPGAEDSEDADADASAQRFNRQLVQESTLDQWLPSYNLHDDKGESISRGRLADCDRIHVPREFGGFDQLSVLSLAADESLSVNDVFSTMVDGPVIYASPNNLYLSRTVFDNDIDNDVDNKLTTIETVIHKFSFASTGKAAYAASGTITGLPVSRTALHEYDGRLFVTAARGDADGFVSVLEESGDSLIEVGRADSIGHGEAIFSVRYIGENAYVMTSDDTLPLNVIDLSDPANPAIGGTLDIFGRYSYLHPVGDDLLLGIGRTAIDGNRVEGAHASLFDVSNTADPQTIDTLLLEDDDDELPRSNEAFLWWEPNSLAVVPFDKWANNYALALRIDIEEDPPKIELASRVLHDPHIQPREEEGACGWYEVPSSSLSWSADEISTMSMVVVCSVDNLCLRFCPDTPGHPYSCTGELQQPGKENLIGSPRATLEEIIAEVRLATSKSNSAELRELLSELESPSVVDASQVRMCFPYNLDLGFWHEISRSIVVADDLWTLSRSYLQANDLDTLDRRSWTDLPSKPEWRELF